MITLSPLRLGIPLLLGLMITGLETASSGSLQPSSLKSSYVRRLGKAFKKLRNAQRRKPIGSEVSPVKRKTSSHRKLGSFTDPNSPWLLNLLQSSGRNALAGVGEVTNLLPSLVGAPISTDEDNPYLGAGILASTIGGVNYFERESDYKKTRKELKIKYFKLGAQITGMLEENSALKSLSKKLRYVGDKFERTGKTLVERIKTSLGPF